MKIAERIEESAHLKQSEGNKNKHRRVLYYTILNFRNELTIILN